MSKVALIKSEDFKRYNFGKFHPLKPERVLLTWELISALGLDKHENCVILEPVMASDDDLALIHDRDYIEFVKMVTRAMEREKSVPEQYIIQGFKYNLGPGDNPMFPGMHEGSAIVVGGTLVAMDAVLQDNDIDKAFNAAGGLHHAMARGASGFCIYNDPAIAIKHALDSHPEGDMRIMYIDVDAHHGDGVQAAFYDDPRVLTVSLHETGKTLFPGTGFLEENGEGEGKGFAVNVPLPPFTFDSTYLEIFDDVILPLARAFKPTLIVSQNGVDTHYSDPLAHLGLTTKAHLEIFNRIHHIADETSKGKLLALGGGGYNISVVPRSWTLLFADLLGEVENLPDKIPADVLENLNDGKWDIDDIIPDTLIDAGPGPTIKAKMNDFKFVDSQEYFVREVIQHVKSNVIPLIRERVK